MEKKGVKMETSHDEECPFCGAEIDIDDYEETADDYLNSSIGESCFDINCPSCDKELHLELDATVRYSFGRIYYDNSQREKKLTNVNLDNQLVLVEE